MRRRVEENRVAGRKPAAPQSVGKAEVPNEAPKSIRLADESDMFTADEKPTPRKKRKNPQVAQSADFLSESRQRRKFAQTASRQETFRTKVAKIPSNYRCLPPACCAKAKAARSSMKKN